MGILPASLERLRKGQRPRGAQAEGRRIDHWMTSYTLRSGP